MSIQLTQQSHLKQQIRHELSSEPLSCHSSKRPSTKPKHDLKNSSTKPTESETNSIFYKFILDQTLFTILLFQAVKVAAMQLVYYVIVKYHMLKMKFAQNATTANTSQSAAAHNPFVSRLTNLVAPSHVCVILNERIERVETIYDTFHYIADMLSSVGVKTLTFYQFDGIPSEVKIRLNDTFQIKDANNNNVDKYNSLKKRRTENDPVDCLDSQQTPYEVKQLNLNFLSYMQGGRSILINACKNIANRVRNNQLDVADINKDLIDSQILESTDLSEPQLVLNIGSRDVLGGFSPWHLRLSEIIKIPSYKLVNAFTITNILIKYNKIEKRFGK